MVRAKQRHSQRISYGYLPWRIEVCSYPNCGVDAEEWLSDCGRLACSRCGVGPPVVVRSNPPVLYCEMCGHSTRV